jgi:hypothetical protein
MSYSIGCDTKMAMNDGYVEKWKEMVVVYVTILAFS